MIHLTGFVGFKGLFSREISRLFKVSSQTIAGPIVASLLYFIVFRARAGMNQEIFGVNYIVFLMPGLAMMTALQNSFSNSTGSIMQSKSMGNIVFTLMAPVGPIELFLAYVFSSIIRGLIVGLGVYFSIWAFVPTVIPHLGIALILLLLASLAMGALGVVVGLWAESYSGIFAAQNFIITPLTFLSGVFFSSDSLPAGFSLCNKLNPMFYAVDGFRYATLGVSEVPVEISLAVLVGMALVVSALALRLLSSGYKVCQ